MEIYIFVCLLIIPIAFLVHRYKQKQYKKLQHNGLVNISYLKKLISFIQMHRGLSAALLNGDDSKRRSLLSLENKIQHEINYLKKQNTVTSNHRWLSFIDHWGRLIQFHSSQDANNSFKQHTQLIANLLYLLEDEAELSHLNAQSLPQLKSIGFVWRELVSTIESIGQSRAIGVGVATRKKCSSVDKIRLSFLQKNIQEMMNETLAKLSAIEQYQTQHSALLALAKEKMKHLNNTIEVELVTAENVTINNDDYFLLATETMKVLDDVFEHQMRQIHHII